MVIKEIRYEGVDWTAAAYKALWRNLVNTVLNLWGK
jgi:hypothetical protein